MGCLGWGLAGCGVLVLITAVAVAIGGYKLSKNSDFRKMLSNLSATPGCTHNLGEIRTALDSYTADHNGKYPPSLSDLVPKYLPDKSNLTCGGTGQADNVGSAMTVEYTPPKPDAPPDTPVVSFHGGGSSLFNKAQVVVVYLRLLKDSSLVQDSVTRTELFVPNGAPGRTNVP
jgi:hypothetical protein